MEDLEWRAVPGYEGHYEVNELAEVRSLKWGKERILKQQTHNRDGHGMYNLCLDNRVISITAARIVCLAWHGPAWGRVAEHIDQDVTNNRPENLRWAVRS